MTFSPLTDKVLLTEKHSSRYGTKIRRVIVHHWATTTSAGLQRLVYSDDQASANYLILNDGTLIGSVPEEYRAWTSGSATADRPSITVEVQNETNGPEWRVSAAAIRTLTRLIADVAKRYKWASVGPDQVEGHREFAATACPGPYLFPRLGDITRDAEAIRSGATPVSNPGGSTGGVTTPTVPTAPTPIEEDDMPEPKDLWAYEINVPAKLQADMGKTAPAALFLVRAANQSTEASAQVAALSAAVGVLAKSAGLRPEDVQAAIDKAVKAALANLTITLTTGA